MVGTWPYDRSRGRSFDNACSAASDIGGGAIPASLAGAVDGADALLLAVPWTSIDEVFAAVGARDGGLASVALIDPTNPVEHGIGRHLLERGSNAEYIAEHAPGAHVVKAFNAHPAGQWQIASLADMVTLAGDDPGALTVVQRLIRDVDATPHVLGGLDRERQLEEFAAMIIALVFGGINPRAAVPEM